MSIKSLSFKMVVAVALLAVMLMSPIAAWAQGETRVYLNPVENGDGQLTVDVVVEDVADLYGAEFTLAYDPAVVSVRDAMADEAGTQVELGAMLPIEQGFVVANQAEAGEVVVAMTMLNPAPAVSGSGTLARISFDVLNDSATSLSFTELNLVSAEMAPIAHRTEAFSFGTESAGGSMMWLMVGGAGAVVLALIGIGAAVAFGGGKKKPVKPSAKPAASAQAGRRGKATVAETA